MRDPKKIDLLYQLRKCLLYLNRSLSAAVACNDRESIREIKKCVDLISSHTIFIVRMVSKNSQSVRIIIKLRMAEKTLLLCT